MPDYRILDIRPGPAGGDVALVVRVAVPGRRPVDVQFAAKPADLETALETAVAELPPAAPIDPELRARPFLRPIQALCRAIDDGVLDVDSAAMQMLRRRIEEALLQQQIS